MLMMIPIEFEEAMNEVRIPGECLAVSQLGLTQPCLWHGVDHSEFLDRLE
jgi:hypothetical protein